MSIKTTLLLLAIAGIALGFITLYEKKQPKSWQVEREKYVLVFDRSSVEGIEITSNEDKVLLRKKSGRWIMEAPVMDRADTEAVNNILNLCESLQREPIAGCANADKKQMKNFGVAKSAMRLKLLGADMPKELLFGKDTAVEGKIYVRLEGSNTVSVTSNELRNIIIRKPDEFRDPMLADFESPSVNSVSVKTAAGEMFFAKESDRWSVVKPLKTRASDFAMNAFLNSVLHTKIAAFFPENNANLNSYGLGEPRGVIAFNTGKRTPAVLEIGARDDKTGGVYARFSDRRAICLLPKESENILRLQPNDLRDRRLMRVEMDMVDRITLRPAQKTPLLLQRKQEEWLMRGVGDSSAPVAANKAKVMQMVKELQTRKITAFVTDVASDLAKYGFDQPQLRITFSAYSSENTAETNAGEMPILTLAFGKTEGDIVYARVEEEPSIVSVDKAVLDAISLSPVEWRSLSVFDYKPEEIVSLEIARYKDGNLSDRLALIANGSNWVLNGRPNSVFVDAPGFVNTLPALNQTNILSFVNTLASLRAMERMTEAAVLLKKNPVPSATPTAQGIEIRNLQGIESPDSILSPSETIEFKTTDGKSHKLIVGAPTSDGTCFGMVEGEPGVFRISAPDVGALKLWLYQTMGN